MRSEKRLECEKVTNLSFTIRSDRTNEMLLKLVSPQFSLSND